MPQQESQPGQDKAASEAERRIYGELLPDVLYLRSRGLLVARFKGDYRVGAEVLTAAGLRERANTLRKSTPAVEPPARKVVAPAAPKPEPTPKPRKNAAAPRICAKCGGPRSAWSTAICRACYLVKPRQIEKVDAALGAGRSAAKAAEVAGISEATARRRAENVHGGDDRPCGCGRPARHLGRCWFRRGESGPRDETPATLDTDPRRLAIRIGKLEAAVAELTRERLERQAGRA